MSKVGKISGFPEWSPEVKLAEQRIVDNIRLIYEKYGFVPLETRAVEPLSVLGAKGIVDKELFAVKRLKSEGDEEAELGLHFDLSVPFARYVAQNIGELTFPFKRYQCQKVWRGERPQKGRAREFYQFDIDTVTYDELPLACDAEVLEAYIEALSSTGVGDFVVKVNSRKILLGFFEATGLNSTQQNASRIAVDKILKIGEEGVRTELSKIEEISAEQVTSIVDFVRNRFAADSFSERMTSIQVDNPTFNLGVQELKTLFALLSKEALGRLEVDLSLARGLDYYTGVIFETFVVGYESFGSVGSGGRYDDLVSSFSNRKLPGVGISIGLTRVVELLSTSGKLTLKKGVTEVLVTVLDEAERPWCNEVARKFRNCGVAVEVYPKSPKLGKQIDYADAKGARYVVFAKNQESPIEIKDLVTKEQKVVTDLKAWSESRER